MDLVDRYLRPGTLQLGESPPLALYVHLPWCLAKCPYCDFNSHAVPDAASGGLPEARYIDPPPLLVSRQPRFLAIASITSELVSPSTANP